MLGGAETTIFLKSETFMPAALYSDLTADLRSLLIGLAQTPESFQSWDAHIELAAAGGLVVLQTKRAKGVVDSLFWGRPPKAAENRQLPEAAAYAAIDRFLGLGAHLALADALPPGITLDEDFPHCAVRLAYRKKGAAKSRSLSMIFIGFNNAADAHAYAARAGETLPLAAARPLMTERLHEWR
jgi:hypothetical protein